MKHQRKTIRDRFGQDISPPTVLTIFVLYLQAGIALNEDLAQVVGSNARLPVFGDASQFEFIGTRCNQSPSPVDSP